MSPEQRGQPFRFVRGHEPLSALGSDPLVGVLAGAVDQDCRIPEPVALTERDLEICAAIGPLLRERGQIFVGIDVIGDWLTEINVTSPTGIQELESFDDINVAGRIWDVIEAKRAG